MLSFSKKLVSLFLLTSFVAQAQYTIGGTLKSDKKLEYALLYKVEAMKLAFVQNKSLQDDVFNFQLSADASSGSYRLIYDTKNNGFVDFFFHKEDVVFHLEKSKSSTSLRFEKSKENKAYQQFLNTFLQQQKEIDSLQLSYLQGPTEQTERGYKKALLAIEKTKASFLKSSKGMFVAQFIKAHFQYNSPKIITNAKDYLNTKTSHFFDAIDFENKTLVNAAFFIDKLNQYVFYTNISEDEKTQQIFYEKAMNTILEKATSTELKKNILELFIHQFAGLKNVVLVDYLLENHFNKLPIAYQNKEFRDSILTKLAAEVGRIAPDFSWTDKEAQKNLLELDDAKYYVLVFWSTGCPHCTREVPKLYDFTKNNPLVKVVAFGMETEATKWEKFTTPLEGWHHALGLGKWDNETARTYQIYSTPSYFVLNADKKIIAKPEKLETLKALIEKLN